MYTEKSLLNALEAHRELNFPANVASTEVEDEFKHVTSGAKVLAYLVESIALIDQYDKDPNLDLSGRQHDIPRTILVNCSNLQIDDSLHIGKDVLKDLKNFAIDINLCDCHGIYLDFETRLNRYPVTVYLERSRFTEDLRISAGAPGALTIDSEALAVGGTFRASGHFDVLHLNCCDVTTVEISEGDASIVDFGNSKISDGLFLSDFQISSELSFRGANIKSEVHLAACQLKSVPDLHDATFPSKTNFFKVNYDLRGTESDTIQRVRALEDAADRFRALRVAMKKAGAQHEEARFFALELRARRRAAVSKNSVTSMGSVELAVSFIYDIASDYGTSIGRSILAFLVWNITFGLLFSFLVWAGPLIFQWNIEIGFGQVLGISNRPIPIETGILVIHENPILGLTLQNAVNPFALFASNAAVKVNNVSLFFLSLIQSIGSIGLGALILLALRSGFQRGGG
jgi:hypothetical protein